MKIILKKDVGGVGQRGKVVDVNDGYGLNYLIARGLGEQATPEKIKQYEASEKESAAAREEQERGLQALASKIDGQSVVVSARASSSGHLYQQLSAELVVDAIKKDFGVDVPVQSIQVHAPIKTIGETKAKIKFGKTTADFAVVVKGIE